MTAECFNRRSCPKLALPLALCVLVGGATLRVVRLADPPLDHHPNRQYHSALLARSFYAEHAPGWSPARRAFAEQTRPHLIEPPLLEHAAAWMYRGAGYEALWMPRLLSVIAWTLGGLALYSLASRWVSPAAVLACLGIYAYLPFGIKASRAFQPDPLMVALTIAAVERGVAWSVSRRPRTASAAVALGTLAVFVKPMAVLLLAPVYATIAFRTAAGWPRALAGLAGVLACASAPSALYFALTMVRRGELAHYTALARAVELMALPEFWFGWGAMFIGAVTAVLAPTLLSLTLPIGAPGARATILALWAGYIVLAIAFPYHIHTHDYYSLVAVPAIALTSAYALHAVGERVDERFAGRMQWAGVVVLAAVVTAGAWSVVRVDNRAAAATWLRLEELDRQLPPDAQLVVLDDSYGKAIQFHTRRHVRVWPLTSDLHARTIAGLPAPLFDELVETAAGAHFFVVTAIADFALQPELAARLASMPQLPSAIQNVNAYVHVYDLNAAIPPVLAPAAANFTFVRGLAYRTPPQTLSLQMVGLVTREWSIVVPPRSPVTVSPLRGIGNAEVTIDVQPQPAHGAVELMLWARGAGSRPVAIRWTTIDGSSRAPIGHLEVPDPEAGAEALTFAGWAMDDIALSRVVVTAVDHSGRSREVAATDRFGARPDLERLFAQWPGAGRGAWTLTLDAAAMRDAAHVRVEAEDIEGHRTTIGERERRPRARKPRRVALSAGAGDRSPA